MLAAATGLIFRLFRRAGVQMGRGTNPAAFPGPRRKQVPYRQGRPRGGIAFVHLAPDTKQLP